MRTNHPTIEVVSSLIQKSQCIQTLVAAFRRDPAARWLFPGEALYDEAFPDFVRAFAGPAFSNGTAHVLEGGAAAWFSPDVHGEDEEVISVLRRTVPDDRIDDVFSMFGQMDAFHPEDRHWYLPLIGVAPGQQGHGIGSLLLEHVINECDSSQTPAYLEATCPENAALYERHGFHRMGTIQAGTSPTLHPMRREPQSTI